MEECIPICLFQAERKIYTSLEKLAKFLKNKRNHLWKRYTGSKSQSDYLAYTKARNALHTLTRNLRKQFE